jgi:hypothetical protein
MSMGMGHFREGKRSKGKGERDGAYLKSAKIFKTTSSPFTLFTFPLFPSSMPHALAMAIRV